MWTFSKIIACRTNGEFENHRFDLCRLIIWSPKIITVGWILGILMLHLGLNAGHHKGTVPLSEMHALFEHIQTAGILL